MATTSNENTGTDANSVIRQRLPESLPSANDLRLGGLQGLAQAVQAHVDSLQREQRRIAAKYGADSIQASAAQSALTTVQARQPIVQAELTRSQITPPKADASVAILYGRILDQSSAPVAGAALSVTGSTATGAQFSFKTKTSDAGQFILRLPPQGVTANIDLEIRAGKAAVTQTSDTFDPRGGSVTYREYILGSSSGTADVPRGQ
jgi:hypothetical protein